MIAPRTQSWLLVGSMSLNLFFAGLFAAHAMRPKPPRAAVEPIESSSDAPQGQPSADQRPQEQGAQGPAGKGPGMKGQGPQGQGAQAQGVQGQRGPRLDRGKQRQDRRDGRQGAAGFARGRGMKGPHGVDVMRDMISAIGGRQDPRVAAMWKDERADLRSKREAIAAAQAQINAALMAEPFDPEALKAAFAGLNEKTGQLQQGAQGAIVELAKTLSAEERARLRELLQKRGDSTSDLR